MTSKRIVYYKDDDAEVVLDKQVNPNDPDHVVVVLHIGLEKFNKSVLGKLKKVWSCLKFDVWSEGFNEIFTYSSDPRMIKLTKHFDDGGLEIGSFYEDGEMKKAVRWDLN